MNTAKFQIKSTKASQKETELHCLRSVVGLSLPSLPPTGISAKLTKSLQNTLGIKEKQKPIKHKPTQSFRKHFRKQMHTWTYSLGTPLLFILIRVKINTIKFKGIKQKTSIFLCTHTSFNQAIPSHEQTFKRPTESHLAEEKSQDKPRCKILLKINVTHQYSKRLRNTRKCFWY